MLCVSRYLLIICFSLPAIFATGQEVVVQLNVNPNLTPYLHEWETTSANDILIHTEVFGTQPVNIVYRIWLNDGSNTEIANSDPTETPPFTLEPGFYEFPLAEVFPISSLNYEGDYQQEIIQTGQLPDGNYTLCVEALQATTLQPVSAPSCAPFVITAFQDPFNIFPPDGQEIDLAIVPNIVFQWSPVAPEPNFGASYQLQVVEVYPGQSVQEAIVVNPTILNEEIVGENQYNLPIDYVPFEPNESGYAWTVIPIGTDGLPYTEPNGQSTPTTFAITEVSTTPGCECISCSLSGMQLFVNGESSQSNTIPAGAAISFQPQYQVACSDPAICPSAIEGILTVNYSSQQHPNQNIQISPGEAISLPGSGLLYLSWSGTAYCGDSECTCEGTYGPVQWQVTEDDVINDPDGTTDDPDNTDSGITRVPDGSDGPAPCNCGPCSLSSLVFKQNGATIEGGSLPTGEPLSISADINASCIPETCSAFIQGYFKVGYTPQGGNWEEHVLTGENDTFIIPEGVGMIIVDFVGTVSCDGVPCPCDGMNGLEIFVKSPPDNPGNDGPPIPENPRDSLPPEKVPPDSLITDRCSPTLVKLDPATPIDLGMVLDDPSTFKYPRAVPLRAEGIDWDYAIFECWGCDEGTSEIKYPVKDLMNLNNYSWRILSGPGSLNDPFRADSLQKAQDNIEAIEKALSDKRAEKTALEERLNSGISQDSLRYSQMLIEIENGLSDLNERLEVHQDSLAGVEAEKNRVEDLKAQMSDSLAIAQDTLSSAAERIVNLEEKLANPMSTAEISALATAENKAEYWETARQAVVDFEDYLAQQTESINNNLAGLLDEERNASEVYIERRDQILSLTRYISDLETQLYNTPTLRKYQRARVKFNRNYRIFYASFISGTSLSLSWDPKKETIDSGALALAIMAPANRDDAYDDLHTELQGFSTMPGMACNSVTSEYYDACQDLSTNLIAATFDYDSALSELSDSNSQLNAGILNAIQSARDSLSGIEGTLDNFRDAAQQAAINYQNANDAAVSQLIQLEADKQALIQAMNEAEQEASLADAEYQNQKNIRIQEFESNQPIWEEYLANAKGVVYTYTQLEKYCIDSLVVLNNELNFWTELFDILKFEEEALLDEVKKYENLIEKIQNKLQALSEEPDKIEEEIQDIENAINDLLEKLKEAQKKKKKLDQPRKTANGPEVYYIPPPLEKVLEINGKYPEFEAWIERVDSAKLALKQAYEDKAALQQRLTFATDQVAWDLLSYKNSKENIDLLENEIDSLNNALADTQMDIASEHLGSQAELQTKLDTAQARLQRARQKAQEAESQEEEGIEERDHIKESLTEQREVVNEKRTVVSDASAQVEYHENLFRNSGATLREKSKKVSDQRKLINNLELEIGRAENKRTIDRAGDEGQSDSQAEAEISNLKESLEEEESKLDNYTSELQSIESSHNSNTTALTNANIALNEADSLFRLEKKKMYHLEDSLLAANEKLKEQSTSKAYWENVVKEWERKVKKIEVALAGEKQNINQEIDSNKAVQDIEARIAGLEENKSAYEDNLNEKQSAIDEAAQDAQKWKEDARKKIEEALENKKNIETEFKEWLEEEFEKVFLEVQLELRGDDEVVDGWRSNDGEQRLIKKLSYQNSRIPVLKNKFASGSLGEERIGAACQVGLDFSVPPAPDELIPPTPLGLEPRTIALIYKNGKPLWEKWGVIPQSETRFLQKDVIFLSTAFISDFDQLIYKCTPPAICESNPPVGRSIRDVGKYAWNIKKLINASSSNWRYSIWETQEVDKPKKDELQELESIFNGNLIQPDQEVKQKSKYKVFPGILIEVPDTIFGIPDTTTELTARVIRGDHKGLVGEKIEFSVQLLSGESSDYGFGGDTLIEVNTKANGYAKTDFSFGDGYASFLVTVKWYRGEDVIDQDEIFLIAPLEIKIHKIGPGPPELAWQIAAKIVNGGAVNIESESGNLPNCVYDGETELSDDCQREMRCVAGLLNYYKGFVNEELSQFEIDDESISLEGKSDTTEYFGIGHTLLKNVAEDIEAEVTASIEEKYKPVGRPGSDKSGLSTELIEEFYIGEEGLPFLVLLDNPVPVGTIINGTGMLGVGGEGFSVGLMIPLQQVKLSINDVTLEKGDEGYLATAGSVAWEGEGGIKASVLSFELEASKLEIAASLGATIEGTVKHEISFPDGIQFSGTFEPSGDFIAEVSNLPEISLADFTLKEGAAIGLDMHSTKGPTENAAFKGVFVPTASLELPEAFANGTTGTKTSISVQDFYVGTSGLGGTISVEGDFFELGFRGYALQGKSLSVTITDNELEAFGAGANIVLGNPFQGDIAVNLAWSGEAFTAEIETEKPVTLPRLNVVFKIQSNSRFASNGDSFELQINAKIKSDHIGDITVDHLAIGSDGSISAEEISLEGDISFGSGFQIQNPKLSFAFGSGEYSVELGGKIILPKLDSTYVAGTVSLSPGPTLGVTMEEAQVSFEYSAVSFTGSFSFNSEEFRGEFDVGLKNLASGIEGLFIFGNRPFSEGEGTFGYWYAELGIPVKIPLGQTGISILKLGGGLGYNYVPPMGNTDGIAKQDGGLAFKALVGFGNTPMGKVCAGEVQMSVTSTAFSLYGIVWVLDKRESFFGEGLITLSWEPPKIDGFVGMGIKLLSADGELIDFDGKINFLFSDPETYIKSERLNGSFIQAIHAEGKIDVNSTRMYLGGRIFYNLNTGFDFTDSERIEVVLNVSAEASIDYKPNLPSLAVQAGFSGYWRVTFVNRIYDLNITSGSIELAASFSMSSQEIVMAASADVTWDFWIASGSMNCDFGYTIPI